MAQGDQKYKETWHAFAEAFAIFAKYSSANFFEEVSAGNKNELVVNLELQLIDDEDYDSLLSLGWNTNEDGLFVLKLVE